MLESGGERAPSEEIELLGRVEGFRSEDLKKERLGERNRKRVRKVASPRL